MSFNAADGDVSDKFASVPKGTYDVVLVKAEKKDGSKEGAQYLNCQFKIVGGDHAKRMLFHILNLKNASDGAVEIAERHLRQLMLSCGVPTLKDKWDLSKLMNVPAKARVAVEKGNDDFPDDSNKIQAFIVPEEGASSGGDSEGFADDDAGSDPKVLAKLKKKLKKATKAGDKKKIKKAQKALDKAVAAYDVPF